MNRKSIIYVTAVFLVVSPMIIQAKEAKLEARQKLKFVRSFYDLQEDISVMRVFPSSTASITKVFESEKVTVKPLHGKNKVHNNRFVGQSLVVSKNLHGTTDAPFSRSMFTIQHRAGISMTFEKPQTVVAMTICGPTTDMDVGMDLLFFDTKGNLIKKVNADTRHDKSLDFDSRGAVFRGLECPKPMIASVQIVPTQVPKNRIVLASIDYFCFSAVSRKEGSVTTVMDLVDQLGSEEYLARENATKKLESLSPGWLSLLRSVDTGNDPEVKLRLTQAIEALELKKINLTPDGTSESQPGEQPAP